MVPCGHSTQTSTSMFSTTCAPSRAESMLPTTNTDINHSRNGMNQISAPNSNFVQFIALTGVLCSVVGCQGERRIIQKPVFSVKSKFLSSGKPAVGAIVTFHPIGDPRAFRSSGRVGSDGVLALSTYMP